VDNTVVVNGNGNVTVFVGNAVSRTSSQERRRESVERTPSGGRRREPAERTPSGGRRREPVERTPSGGRRREPVERTPSGERRRVRYREGVAENVEVIVCAAIFISCTVVALQAVLR
jgi:hypothetical protein